MLGCLVANQKQLAIKPRRNFFFFFFIYSEHVKTVGGKTNGTFSCDLRRKIEIKVQCDVGRWWWWV